jgi:hypothetical protein
MVDAGIEQQPRWREANHSLASVFVWFVIPAQAGIQCSRIFLLPSSPEKE